MLIPSQMSVTVPPRPTTFGLTVRLGLALPTFTELELVSRLYVPPGNKRNSEVPGVTGIVKVHVPDARGVPPELCVQLLVYFQSLYSLLPAPGEYRPIQSATLGLLTPLQPTATAPPGVADAGVAVRVGEPPAPETVTEFEVPSRT